jgi:hypothetical protein
VSSLTNDLFVCEWHIAGVINSQGVWVIFVRMRRQGNIAEDTPVNAGVVPVNGRDRDRVRARPVARSVYQEAVNARTGLGSSRQWQFLDPGNNVSVLGSVQIEVGVSWPAETELPDERPKRVAQEAHHQGDEYQPSPPSGLPSCLHDGWLHHPFRVGLSNATPQVGSPHPVTVVTISCLECG